MEASRQDVEVLTEAAILIELEGVGIARFAIILINEIREGAQARVIRTVTLVRLVAEAEFAAEAGDGDGDEEPSTVSSTHPLSVNTMSTRQIPPSITPLIPPMNQQPTLTHT